jgi:hypothetical protein
MHEMKRFPVGGEKFLVAIEHILIHGHYRKLLLEHSCPCWNALPHVVELITPRDN